MNVLQDFTRRIGRWFPWWWPRVCSSICNCVGRIHDSYAEFKVTRRQHVITILEAVSDCHIEFSCTFQIVLPECLCIRLLSVAYGAGIDRLSDYSPSRADVFALFPAVCCVHDWICVGNLWYEQFQFIWRKLGNINFFVFSFYGILRRQPETREKSVGCISDIPVLLYNFLACNIAHKHINLYFPHVL